MEKDYLNWWQELAISERFEMMRKYDYKKVSDKIVKRIWRKECLTDECKCIRFVGSDKWYSNGCKLHPQR